MAIKYNIYIGNLIYKTSKGLLWVMAFVFLSIPLSAEISKGKFGIGANYPGLDVKIFLSDKLSLELKGQIEDNIIVGGLRGYYYLKTAMGRNKLKVSSEYYSNPEVKYLLFSGLEADFVSFDYDDHNGTGFAGEFFAGIEYFLRKNISAQLDLGPAMIFLEDEDTSEFVRGLEYVINFGIYYYFGK